MSRARTRMRLLLLALLGAVLAAAAARQQEWEPGEAAADESEVAAPVARRAAPSDALPPVLRLPRRAAAVDPVDLFASRSWRPPAPPPPVREAPAVAPKPAPPPLPFIYLGRYQDAATPVVFLLRGERLLPVTEGQVIEGEYRIEAVRGDTLVITYLPLNHTQTLQMGPAG